MGASFSARVCPKVGAPYRKLFPPWVGVSTHPHDTTRKQLVSGIRMCFGLSDPVTWG